jgi:hypothetical protein
MGDMLLLADTLHRFSASTGKLSDNPYRIIRFSRDKHVYIKYIIPDYYYQELFVTIAF